MAKMTSAQSQAWDCLKPIEQQSLFLQLSEGKSSWEAGNVLGITHYKYIEIRERSQKFFKLFTDFFEEHGSIFRPDSPCEPQFRDFIEACIEKRMKCKDAVNASGDSANTVPCVNQMSIIRNMELLQESEDPWDICTRRLIFEFDRWNNHRILPRMLQQPSAFKRRENKREKILLKYILTRNPDFVLERIRERWFYKVKPSKKAYWVVLISKTLYTDGYYLLKIRPEEEVVKELSKFYLYIFDNREDADTYGFLATQYQDRTSSIKLSQKFWPEYREIIHKAVNYNEVNNMECSTRHLDMAYNQHKPGKRAKKKKENQGEQRVPTSDFYKK
jgi:hypothetical protein